MTELTGRLLLEAIQREALIILSQNLNDKINDMESTWQAEDETLWDALGMGNPEWSVEQIPQENFFPGTIPSLIDAPIERYPNVGVICYIGNPSLSEDDTGELYTNRLAVEIMVKSGPFPEPKDGEENTLINALNFEQEANSRIQKTLDAAHLTLLENRSLNNLIPELPAPRATIGDIFVRRMKRGHGEKFIWQGGALEYSLMKYVNFVT